MKTSRKILLGVAAAAVAAGLAGCPSPFLTAIKREIAKAPFTGSNYSFLRQWGNPYPQYSFFAPEIVRADTIGNIYVADSSARVRKFDGNGNLLTTVNLKTYTAYGLIYDLAFDASGNMFLLDQKPEIQQYDANGNYVSTFTYAFTYTPVALTVDGTYVYVIDSTGIYKFTYSGTFIAKYTPSYSAISLSGANSISTDGAYLYIMDAGNKRVVRTDTSGSGAFAWTGSPAYTGPAGIAVAYNHVYVVDSSAGIVEVTDISGGSASSFGSTFLTTPNSVTVDNAGAVYVTDAGARVNGTWEVRKFSGTSVVATWAETDSSAGNGVFGQPVALTFDSSGNIYVEDSEYCRIEEFGPTGNFIRQWGSSGSGFGQFSSGIFAINIAVDSKAGKIYVPDGGNNRVEIFNMSGVFQVVLAPTYTFSSPYGAALDSSGNVFITDTGNAQVAVFSSTGLHLRTWGGTNSGTSIPGKFAFPLGIAVDGSGNVYVSDYIGCDVQKLDGYGNPISQIGTFNTSFGTPGDQFYLPAALGVDPLGNLYVADIGNHRIRKFDPSGNAMGQLGGVGAGGGGLGLPFGVAVTPGAQVIVADYYSCLVEEFSPKF